MTTLFAAAMAIALLCGILLGLTWPTPELPADHPYLLDNGPIVKNGELQ